MTRTQRERTTTQRKTIPVKLEGVVIRQMVRCGKPNCECARGELHGPYHYRYWRDGECWITDLLGL